MSFTDCIIYSHSFITVLKFFIKQTKSLLNFFKSIFFTIQEKRLKIQHCILLLNAASDVFNAVSPPNIQLTCSSCVCLGSPGSPASC